MNFCSYDFIFILFLNILVSKVQKTMNHEPSFEFFEIETKLHLQGLNFKLEFWDENLQNRPQWGRGLSRFSEKASVQSPALTATTNDKRVCEGQKTRKGTLSFVASPMDYVLISQLFGALNQEYYPLCSTISHFTLLLAAKL